MVWCLLFSCNPTKSRKVYSLTWYETIYNFHCISNRFDPITITMCKKCSVQFSSVQFSSVAQSCTTLCDPMNRSTRGLSVHHHLPEFTQTHVHQVRDAIQPSHPGSPFFSCPLRGPTWETLKKKLCGLELRWLLEDEMRAWPKFVKTFDWLSWFLCTWIACDHHRGLLQWSAWRLDL